MVWSLGHAFWPQPVALWTHASGMARVHAETAQSCPKGHPSSWQRAGHWPLVFEFARLGQVCHHLSAAAPWDPEQLGGLSPQHPFLPEAQPREMLLSGDPGPAGSQVLGPRMQGAAAGSWPGPFLAASAPPLCVDGECHEFPVFNQARLRVRSRQTFVSLSFPEMLLTASDLDDRRTCAFWDIVSLCVGGRNWNIIGEIGVSLGEAASPRRKAVLWWGAILSPPQLHLLRDPREFGRAPWWR